VSQTASVERAIAEAHRREWAFVLAATARVARDLDLAEECVQEAYVAALEAWKRDGVPERPAAWLTTTAKRKALDALRRGQTLRSKLPLLVEPDEPDEADMNDPTVKDPTGGAVPSDRLRLIFTCCHPALSREDLVGRALDLARTLRELMPGEREVGGCSRCSWSPTPGVPPVPTQADACSCCKNRTAPLGTDRPSRKAMGWSSGR